jgi:hypothetical protein
MIVEGYPESCTCCPNCGNPSSRCVCCMDCLETLDLCRCQDRIGKIWNEEHRCSHCPMEYDSDSNELESVLHPKNRNCPLCCPYCKEHKDECSCCDRCHKTPCICCTECGDLRIKCKCWFEMVSGRVLSHFIRHAVLYHKYHKMKQELRESYFPANTAALITIPNED